MTHWSAATIQADFDEIARHDQGQGWNHNNHYHSYLLRQMPMPSRDALDIGCGMGEFSRRVAERAEHILALDLSPEMIQIAQERSSSVLTINYQVGDILSYPLPTECFDFVGSIATFHHLDLASVLEKIKPTLKAGGVLAVLDLYQAQTAVDYLTSMAAIPVTRILNRRKNGRPRRLSPQAQAAWAQHDQHDRYLPLSEVRRVCADLLPGATVKRHLLWRYSLVWCKPTHP